jgi:copper homeostasis protein
MPAPILVEACVDSIESALAAARGGAHRIELCANLIEGGTTPSAGTLAVCRSRLDVPIFVLLRPRGGDFLYSAAELRVTFHRAFDVCRDAGRALETLIALGVERVLTSGQAATAPEGAAAIAGLVRQAAGRIGILPGGGVTEENVATLVRATGVTEVHLTGAAPHQSGMTFRAPEVVIGAAAPRSEYEWNVTDADRIRRVVALLANA